MTEAQRLAERVEVVVKQHNNYGGAPAGTHMVVSRAELQVNTRCLEEVTGPPAQTPRTARVSIPAHAAAVFGMPLGRRQEGPIVYEVTRLPPDGKAPLPSREDLERAAESYRRGAPFDVRVLDMPEVKEVLRRADGEVKRAHEQLAKESEYLRRQEETSERLRADLGSVQQEIKDTAGLLGAAREEIAKLQQDLTKSQAEARALTGELAAAKATVAKAPPAPEPPVQSPSTPAAAPDKPKAKG